VGAFILCGDTNQYRIDRMRYTGFNRPNLNTPTKLSRPYARLACDILNKARAVCDFDYYVNVFERLAPNLSDFEESRCRCECRVSQPDRRGYPGCDQDQENDQPLSLPHPLEEIVEANVTF